ncbi:MAG TPA: tyrosine-protein phosphatase, partial [Gaiellales bacterium]|nr:tyrosine-protein phosphatase [Gaiellales bacterium]
MTRFGAVIRADNVRRLRDARTLVDHGVVRVVDLRFHSERADDPIDELPVEVVHVSLLGDWDESYLASLEREMASRTAAEYLAWSYLHFLDHRRDRFALALAAVADAPQGAVCVHC